MRLTDRGITTVVKNGFFHIILPDETAFTGYRSYQLSADKSFINRGILSGNNAKNAEPYNTYSTDINTLELPVDANKIGTLEAFGNTDIDIRYSTYTFGVFEMWGIKKTGSTWGTWTKISGGSSDHGELDGLADDDHPQYLNQERGDLRYLRIGETVTEDVVIVGSISLSGNIYQTGTFDQLDINPYRLLRIGRSTDHASFAVDVYKGNNSTTINHHLAGNGSSYLCADNGMLAIGSNSPLYKVDIYSIPGQDNRIRFRQDGDLVAGSFVGRVQDSKILSIKNSEDSDIHFYTDNNLRVIIDSLGYFGIGGEPTTKFEVFGSLGNVQIEDNGIVMNFTRPNTTYFKASSVGGQFAWTVNGDTATNAMVLDVAGNLVLKNNKSLKFENNAGTAIRTLLINSGNDVYLGGIDNDTNDTYIRRAGSTKVSIASSYAGFADAIQTPSISSAVFTSGFAGSGWKAAEDATFDNLTVRKGMKIYDLNVSKIRSGNGSYWFSDGMRINSMNNDATRYRLYIDTEVDSIPFLVGDIIRCQSFNGNNVKTYEGLVDSVFSDYILLYISKWVGDAPEVGDEIVRVGSTTSASRRGAVYITSNDDDAPYIDVVDGQSSVGGGGVRYIRDYLQGSTVNIGNHWCEIEALQDTVNRALGKSVTSNYSLTDGVYITEGNTSSSPYANGTNGTYQYVQVDLGAVYDIDTVKVWHYYNDGRTYYSTKTQVSKDGVNWVTIFDSAVSGTYVETSAGKSSSVPRYSVKARLGKLDGIVDASAGLDGTQTNYYGLYSDNVHLKGHIFSQSGEIGGWKLANNSIVSANSRAMMHDTYGYAVSLNALTEANILSVASRVNMFYQNSSNWGLKGVNNLGMPVFHLGSANKIAGFYFDDNNIYNNSIKINGANGNIDLLQDTEAIPPKFSLIDDSDITIFTIQGRYTGNIYTEIISKEGLLIKEDSINSLLITGGGAVQLIASRANTIQAGYGLTLNAGSGYNITANRAIYAPNFYPTSDARLKDKITYEFESNFDALKPTSYFMDGELQYGFIAQDLLKSHKSLVNGTGTEKDGKIDYHTIKLLSIIAMNTKEIQKLKKIIKNKLNKI